MTRRAGGTESKRRAQQGTGRIKEKCAPRHTRRAECGMCIKLSQRAETRSGHRHHHSSCHPEARRTCRGAVAHVRGHKNHRMQTGDHERRAQQGTGRIERKTSPGPGDMQPSKEQGELEKRQVQCQGGRAIAEKGWSPRCRGEAAGRAAIRKGHTNVARRDGPPPRKLAL